MKQFELKALGLEEMATQDLRQTDGGSLLALAIAAVAIMTLCGTCVVNIGSGDVDVNNSDTKTGGTDVNTDVGVSVI